MLLLLFIFSLKVLRAAIIAPLPPLEIAQVMFQLRFRDPDPPILAQEMPPSLHPIMLPSEGSTFSALGGKYMLTCAVSVIVKHVNVADELTGVNIAF